MIDKTDSLPKLVLGSKAMVARFYGRSSSAVERWSSEGMPGRPRHYDLWAIQAWVREKFGSYNPGETLADDDDDIEGADSPWLERSRKQKTLELARKNLIGCGQLLDVNDVTADLNRLASILRNACDTLARMYGEDAAAIITEALDDFERESEERFDAQRVRTEIERFAQSGEHLGEGGAEG